MGFAASQARFLSLTARLSDNEFEAGQIAQERVALTEKMSLFAEEYEKSTTNQVLTANVYDGANSKSNVTLTYGVVVAGRLEGGLGMKIVNAANQIVVPDIDEMHRMMEEDSSLSYADFFVYEDVNDSSALQRELQAGNLYFAASKNEENGEWDKKGFEHISDVTLTYDKSDDAAAQAKYTKLMAKAEKTDSMLEMQLDKLDTEHRAIETEMDSVQKVMDDNVEKSFKTFG